MAHKRVKSPGIAAFLLLAILPAMGQDMIGSPAAYVTQASDTLLDLARSVDAGYVEMRAANPDIDPWLPGAGKLIQMPTAHLLPNVPRRGIVINLSELRLYVFLPHGAPQSFPIGIGGEGKETPPGNTVILAKRPHPVWIPTASEHEEDPDLPARIPPGPDNPMGDYALYLGWKGYALHGTDKPFSIGRRDSHGCIRLYPEDIEKLYAEVRPGTPVTVIDQQVKTGWMDGALYVEIHPTQADADRIEEGETLRPEGAVDADDQVIRAAGRRAGQLDWYALQLAEQRRDGLPVRVLDSTPQSKP